MGPGPLKPPTHANCCAEPAANHYCFCSPIGLQRNRIWRRFSSAGPSLTSPNSATPEHISIFDYGAQPPGRAYLTTTSWHAPRLGFRTREPTRRTRGRAPRARRV